ncbi:galactose-1-epimerase [Vibrio sp. T187]|uniref:galactose-1-epimerase n=1 Tax=Vibrio TaxID=662 RepID=UPI0010C959F1|nr:MULTISPECIES: galactose-1-epimerase [Vibrio]MBW3694273.1 galactose-1-epimerase [Vibrio sp. T187]
MSEQAVVPTLLESMTRELAKDGHPAKVITLRNNNGMTATFMDIGATWLSCRVPVQERPREVLLGVTNIGDFYAQQAYMGTTVGRYANRIAQGQLAINDQVYQLTTNQAGNTLHGGVEGFDKRRWEIVEHNSQSVVFYLESADGDQGFPGNVHVSVHYELTDENQVSIRYLANTDQTTAINLTNHAYFNLLGADEGHDCLGHTVSINSEQYLPTNEVGIPLGALEPVSGTSFDLNEETVIGDTLLAHQQQIAAKGYDHSFLLDPQCKQGACAATVISPDGLVTLKVFSSKPAMQLYTGNWLAGTPNRIQGQYQDYAGLALETQFLPDSPNHPEWQQESCILTPDQEYAYSTCYQFEFSGDSSD